MVKDLFDLHFDSGRVVRVEPPHSSGAGAARPPSGPRRRGGGFALSDSPAARARRRRGAWAAGPNVGRAGCRSGLKKKEAQIGV